MNTEGVINSTSALYGVLRCFVFFGDRGTAVTMIYFCHSYGSAESRTSFFRGGGT